MLCVIQYMQHFQIEYLKSQCYDAVRFDHRWWCVAMRFIVCVGKFNLFFFFHLLFRNESEREWKKKKILRESQRLFRIRIYFSYLNQCQSIGKRAKLTMVLQFLSTFYNRKTFKTKFNLNGFSVKCCNIILVSIFLFQCLALENVWKKKKKQIRKILKINRFQMTDWMCVNFLAQYREIFH